MSAKLATNDLEAFWMPFTANRQYKRAPRLFVSAERMHYTTDDGRKVLDGTSGLWCVNAGHCRPKIVEAIRKQVGELDFAGTFQMGHPQGLRMRLEARQHRPAGLRPRVLHQLGLRVGRDRAQDRARLSPGEGQRFEDPPDRPRARLSRRQFRRHLGRRHRQQPQMVRHAALRRRPSPPHPRSRPQRLQPRRARAWRRACRRSRAARRAARRLDHRRGDRRAGRLLDRRAGPAQGLSQAPRRDLRQARHPADLRRGHHRLRPPRHAVRRRLFRRLAGHHHHGQGHHQRRHSDGRGVREVGRSTTPS